MKLIVIYGPPASGKLTIANELSKILGYKVFHNHLTLDLIQSVFEIDKGKFWDYVNKVRLDLINIIVKENIDFIITTGYTIRYPKTLDKIVKIVKKNKGKVYFVQLKPDKKELFKRVKHIDRKRYAKIIHTKVLKKSLDEYDFFSSVPYEPNYVIDNTNLSANKAAQLIKQHYGL